MATDSQDTDLQPTLSKKSHPNPEKEQKMDLEEADESGTNEIKLVVHQTNDDFLLKDLTFKV